MLKIIKNWQRFSISQGILSSPALLAIELKLIRKLEQMILLINLSTKNAEIKC